MSEEVFGLTKEGIRRTAETNRRVSETLPDVGRSSRKVFPPGIKLVQGILVDYLSPARGPLTGATSFTLRPIVNRGSHADALASANDFELLVARINRHRQADGLADLDVAACDIGCVNRSIDARGEPGTYAKVDQSDGEYSLDWLDCHPSDEGLEAIINYGGGGMGGGPMGDASFGG